MLKDALRLALFSALVAFFITIFRPLLKWLGYAVLLLGLPAALTLGDAVPIYKTCDLK